MDAVRQLENTPEILRLLLDGLTEEDAGWKPAPDRFSIAEVIEHLSHVEGHCYRARLDATLEVDGAAWEAYEIEAYKAAGQFSGRSAEDSFDHWEEQRESNLELLNGLEEGWEKRCGMHPRFGRVTLGELVNEWAYHDLGHVRQIAELVRARKYHPEMGPYRPHYKVKP
ncbi:MAG: DinB family protein [Bryobacteraceae bacterium]